VVELVVLDVNETLFGLDPVAARMADVGLAGGDELWFARVVRDGVAAAAAGHLATFADLARHHLEVLLAAQEGSRVAPPSLEGSSAVDHVLDGFDELRPHPDVAPALRALAAAGLPAVALTNGSAELTRRLLARAGLTELVAAVHDVTEVGRWKPAPEAYRWLLDRFGVAPPRAALVAVHPWDVLGAQRAGLLGAWLDRDGTAYPTAFGAPDVRARDLQSLVARLRADGPPR
jgi:2-haloacid dehalogenase